MQSDPNNTEALSNSEELQSHLHTIELIDNKHTLITSLKELNTVISSQTLSDTFTIALVSKLLKKLFSPRIFQLGLHKDTQVKTDLCELLNKQNISKLSLYKSLLQILEHLSSTSLGDSKMDYDRRGLFEDILIPTLLDPEELPKLFVQVYGIKMSNEFTEILRTLFNFPNLVSNFLETCPPALRPENFYKYFMKISLEQENSFKKNKSHYYLQFLNTLFINGQTRVFAEYWIQQLTRDYNSLKTDTWQQDLILNLLTDNSETFFNYAKVIREILLFLSKPSNNTVTEATKTALIKLLLKKITRKQFILNYLPKYLNDKEFNSKSGTVLVNLILNYPATVSDTNGKAEEIGDSELIKRGIETGLAIWSEIGFVQNASVKHMKYVSNYLRKLIIKANKEALMRPEIIEFIQTGVSNRLSENMSGGLQKNCAEAVWTAYLRNLEIKEAVSLIEKEGLYDAELPDDDEKLEDPTQNKEEEIPYITKQSPKEEKKEPLVQEVDDEDDEFFEVNQEVEEESSIFTLRKPKHIYDCLLGLRTEDRERIEYSLKYVNYLIRKKLSDVEFYAEELALTLCRINNQFDWEMFEEYRSRALISLVIIIPEQVSQCLIKRFFYSETSLGEKILLLDILGKAAKELSDNPDKYDPEKYNELNEGQNFYFKPVGIKYYNEEEKRKEDIEKQKQDKIEEKTRRWGDTKRKKEQENKDEKLKSMTIKEVLIINSDSQKIFVNRFNTLCNYFFFPLVVPLREKKKWLLKDHILLNKVITVMKVYLQASKNAPTFYSILEEILDFLMAFVKNDDNNVMQEILTCFYLVSTIINKNVVLYYENIVKKLLLLMSMITDMGKKVEKFKIFIYEISANLQKIFEVEMGKDIQY